jgi:gamma-butyrobetaine dioxygenase
MIFFLSRVDHEKKIEQATYSDEFRYNHMSVEPKLMKSFYKAYFRYSELTVDKKTSFWHKMKPGDLITTNNYRVLHARTAFKDRSDNVRLLELGYFDLDCVQSKIRLLAEEQGIPSPLD